MERITITVDNDLVRDIDRLSKARGYQNRSEAIRDLVRAGIAQAEPLIAPSSHCIGGLFYVYNQDTRDLPKRLGSAFRDHHHLAAATLRVALDHESCMEVSVLRGRSTEVETFAGHVIAERGVRHGQLVMIPADIDVQRHAHGHGKPHAHPHVRVR